MGGCRKPYVESLKSKSNTPLHPTRCRGQTRVIKWQTLTFCLISPWVLLLECIKRYWEAGQIYALTHHGSNWGHKTTDFVFLPYISFIIGFTALECIKRYWEESVESIDSPSYLSPTPLYGSNWGHKIADFVFLPYISFKTTLLTNYSIY